MKILNVLETLDRGGIETFILNNYDCMNKRNIEYSYLIMRKSHYQGLQKQVENSGSKVLVYENKPTKLWKHIYNIYKILRTTGPYDVVQTHWGKFNGVVLFLSYFCGVKKRFSFVHLISLPDKNPVKKIYRFVFSCLIELFATRKFACSAKAGKSVYLGKFKILNNAIDLAKFRFNQNIRDVIREELSLKDKFVLIQTARFAKEKNHLFTLEVFKFILETNPNSHLIFCGDGVTFQSVKQKAKKLNIIDKISFLGAIPNVNEILQAADAFILPSTWEALGLAAIEAQGAGLPCLLADNIPPEAFVVNAFPLSLQAGVKVWAEKLLTFTHFSRGDTSNILKKAGFDIKDTASYLQEEYLK